MKINKCRIIIASTDDGSLPEDFSGDCEDLPQALDTCDQDCNVACYEYNAPEGFETSVGRGILFDHDWCQDDTVSLVQVWDEKNQTWT